MVNKTGKALVIGAGISGIRASLDLAEFGYQVTLIEQAPSLGGILSRLDFQFPSNQCGMCKMLPMVNRDAASQACLRRGFFHENIDLRLSTSVVSIDGEAGDFRVKLRQAAQPVDPNLCRGCGLCEEVCPVTVPETFNAGLSSRKAIGLPIPHSFPNQYMIDLAVCNRCGACLSVCPTGAIQLTSPDRKQFRILVVDDELIVRDSIKEWLMEEGFDVHMASSGPEALEMIAAQPYQMMLLDIKMPQMDGVTVLEKAKDILPELWVVMMTAYATVETAVSAMKIGAVDYLLKPFDPDKLVSKVVDISENIAASQKDSLTVGAVVVCTGVDYYDPRSGKNPFGYGIYPNVITNPAFERILSGSGPYQGRLLRPSDNRPIKKMAWIQCVGSRDVQCDADFCSSICCMIAVKEALLAKRMAADELEATIFYMDMRTFGKSYQRYKDQAEKKQDIRLIRGKIHTLLEVPETKDIKVRYVDVAGDVHEELFDLIVLSVGQRPNAGNAALLEMLGLPTNSWGFPVTNPFFVSHTEKQGVFFGGALTGLKDISQSVIHAGSAALSTSRILHKAGGGLWESQPSPPPRREIMRDSPKVLVVVCTCHAKLLSPMKQKTLADALKKDPVVQGLVFVDNICTIEGWGSLIDKVHGSAANRILVGTCTPQIPKTQVQQLAQSVALDSRLIETVRIDMDWTALHADNSRKELAAFSEIRATLIAGIACLKYKGDLLHTVLPIQQRALIVGGGIAGLTAAVAIADHGYPVDIVEQTETFGGNLTWLTRTLEGHHTQSLLADLLARAEKHPHIQMLSRSRVVSVEGQVGNIVTTIEDPEGTISKREHGVLLFATGGEEAPTRSYGYGTSPAIVTQQELAQKLDDKTICADTLSSVIMIQCVDSREEPRNYCSRICCTAAIKHALRLKEENPAIAVYVLYRDIMTDGFSESYYTKARKQGVLFIQYDPDKKPNVIIPENTAGCTRVQVFEPILGRSIAIETDLVVLATGITPKVPVDLIGRLGIETDPDGFFQEAESKWRPVDTLKEGIFVCGLSRAPCSIAEAISSAEAAAQRALRILAQQELPAGNLTAGVRHSLCTLCEQCIAACPYGARTIDMELDEIQINIAMCQGCGACAAACPNGASILEGFPVPQVFEMIDAAIESRIESTELERKSYE